MMKAAKWFTVLITLTIMACNNYFHDLIPPDANRILSFSVEGMIERALISDNAVDATVNNSSALSALVPEIKISPKATLIPLTYEYLKAAFPGADILSEAAAVYAARDISEYVMDLIKRNPNFTVPSLDIPIDFSGPVHFLVVSGQGTIRQYTVHVVKDTGEPRILGFGFSKYDNPELIRDAFTTVNHSEKTVNAAVLYPMEMYVSYALIPSFEIMGDRLEVDGKEIQSGVDAIQFTQALGAQTKTLTVWRKGQSADYTLTAEFSEDPDSIRSIIDFRFYKAGNAGIAATAVGSIINNNTRGTVSVQVFYSGARPSILTPAFLSPGTVSVAGVTQVSGSSSHDFSQTLEYRVVSRNNLYTRTYTVVVDLIDITSAAPVFTAFKFSSGLNPELVQDTDSQISDSASLIMITARYGGTYPPEMLIPEFRATGLATVFGSVQTSGMSAQNFLTQIKYTVTNPENTLFKRDYWVQVTFIRDDSSNAIMNSFSFHPDENPGLADELEGRIDQTAGTITIFAPIGSGVTSRTMIPRFRAAGQALVENSVQISGASGQLFNAPVVYEVVSANGVNRKTYTVTVRELQSTIFVNRNAFGMGDGTNWADAFRELGAACEAAAQFPEDAPKEIWIAAGTYQPSVTGNREEYFLLAANTSYIGGFAGYETAKSQRNVAANKTVISGDLGGGVYAYRLFASGFDDDEVAAVNGDLSFDSLEFTAANAATGNAVDDRGNGAAICAGLSGGGELRITDCDFNNLEANGGAVYVNGGGLVIASASFEEVTSVAYGAVYGAGLSAVRIDNVNLHNIDSTGLYFFNCSGDMEINSVSLQEITNNGIHINSSRGKKDFNDITGRNIAGSYGVYVSGGSGDITMTGSSFDTRGIYFSSGGSPVRISGTTVKNVSVNNGIYASGGNMVIENVVVDNVTNGTGMSLAIANNGALRVSGSTIKDVKAPNGNGLSLTGSGSAVISNTTIKNIEAGANGAIYAGTTGDLTIIDSTIDTVVSSYGISRTGSGNTVISNTTINNINASNSAVYAGMTGDLTIIDSTINTVVAARGLSLMGSGNTVISNTTIKNINAGSDGYAIYVSGRGLVITDTTIDNITANYGVYGVNLSGVGIDGGINKWKLHGMSYGMYFSSCNGDIDISGVDLQNISNYGLYFSSCNGDIDISGVDLQNISNYGLYFSYCNGDMEINNVDLQNISNDGIYIISGSGKRELSNITGYNIRGNYNVYVISGSGNITLAESSFDTGGRINFSPSISANVSINISDTTTKNVSGSSAAIFTSGGNIVIERVKVENVPNGGGINIYASGTGQITGTSIKSCRSSTSGAGIFLGGSGSMVISNTTIEDVETTNSSGGAIYVSSNSGNLTIRDSTIKNAKTTYNGGGIYHASSGSLIITGTTIEDVESGAGGGAIYANSSNLTIRDSMIKNAKAVSSGGGIAYNGYNNSGSLVISGTTIENVEATSYRGGGIFFGNYSGSFSGDLTIRDSMIKNAYARNDGGGISYRGSGNVTISGTTIDNVEANYGGGMYMYANGSGQMALSNTTIKNARASVGGGIFLSNYVALISATTFENTVANSGGAIAMQSNSILQFRLNNIYNGTLLNTQAALINLANSGLINAPPSTSVVVVP